MRPSMDVASFRATKGRVLCSRANRNGALRAAASSANSPCSTATARRMASASGPRSEAETDADPSVDVPRFGVEVAVGGAELLVLAGLVAELGHELHRHEVEPGVREQHLAIVGHGHGDRLDSGVQR